MGSYKTINRSTRFETKKTPGQWVALIHLTAEVLGHESTDRAFDRSPHDRLRVLVLVLDLGPSQRLRARFDRSLLSRHLIFFHTSIRMDWISRHPRSTIVARFHPKSCTTCCLGQTVRSIPFRPSVYLGLSAASGHVQMHTILERGMKEIF